jgi:hypothetical protein
LHNANYDANICNMKQKITIQFKPDPDGVFAFAVVRGPVGFGDTVELFAFGISALQAEANLIRKINFFLHPTETPPSREIEI